VKIELLVTDGCEPCKQAEALWHELATERGIELTVVKLSEPYGRVLAERLHLKTIPAVVVDGVLRGIGVPTRADALALIDGL
jgi:glutaredoxin